MLLNCGVGEDFFIFILFLRTLFYFFLIFKYKFIYFNWGLITLQYCIGFAIHQHESATFENPLDCKENKQVNPKKKLDLNIFWKD